MGNTIWNQKVQNDGEHGEELTHWNFEECSRTTCLVKLFEKLELTADEGNIHPGVLSQRAFENTFHDPLRKFGKLLYIQMQKGCTDKERITKEQFVKAGKEILKIPNYSEQKKYYFTLFSAGKHYLNKEDCQQMVAICYALTLSMTSVEYSKSENDDKIFDAVVKGMFGIRDKLHYCDFDAWLKKNFPQLLVSVHHWVLSILTGSKSLFEEVITSIPALEHIFEGHHLLSKSVLWLLSITLPTSYTQPHCENCLPTTSTFSAAFQFLIKKARLPQCQSWTQLYSSSKDGLSMNRFSHHVVSYNGPCITLIHFEGRNLYCIAMDCGWREGSSKYGGDDCCLLQLHPFYRVVQCGRDIIQWNEHIRELPKGIEIGQNHRSVVLKIPPDFDKIKHYDVSCSLHSIEVWGCGGQAHREAQLKQKLWELQNTEKHKSRKLQLNHSESWEENPDRQIIEWGGVSTNHSCR